MSPQPDLHDLFVDQADWIHVARDVSGGALLAARQPVQPLPGSPNDSAAQASAPGPLGSDRPAFDLQGDGSSHSGHVPTGMAESFGEPSAWFQPDATEDHAGHPARHEFGDVRQVGQPAGSTAGHDGPAEPGSNSGPAAVLPSPAAAKAIAHPPGSVRPSPETAEGQADGRQGMDDSGGSGGEVLQLIRTSTTTFDSHMSLFGQLTHDLEAGLWTMTVAGSASVSMAFASSWVLQVVHGHGPASVLGSQAWSAHLVAEVSFHAEAQWRDGEDAGPAMVLAQAVPQAAWADILPNGGRPGLLWPEDRPLGSVGPSIGSPHDVASGDAGFAEALFAGDLGAGGLLPPLSLIG